MWYQSQFVSLFDIGQEKVYWSNDEQFTESGLEVMDLTQDF